MKKCITFFLTFSLFFKVFLISFEVLNLTNSLETKEVFSFMSKDDDSKIIAHRGAAMCGPENTLPAYEQAGKMGFWGAECDTSCTKDGKWVLLHDLKLDRTTNGKGELHKYTLEEIKRLNITAGKNIDMYNDIKIPTLEEYLRVCKYYNMTPIIEIKESVHNNYDSFMGILSSENVKDKAIIISFSIKELLNIAKRDSNINLQLIIKHPIATQDVIYAKKIGLKGIDTKVPTKEGVKLAHDNGLLVNCYLINTMQEARNVLEMGVDQFTTDWINIVD